MYLLVKIYLVRHCETEGNLHNAFQGTTDCDITEKGERQLGCLKKRFADIHIDRVYSSPLKRAYKTALAIVGDRALDIEKNPDFIEINGGIVEKMLFSDIPSVYPDFEDIWRSRPHEFAPKDAEPMTAVYERVWQGLKKVIEDKNNEGKTILITSHGATIRNLLCRLSFNDITRLCDTDWSTNTSVTLLICDKDKITVEFANDDSHLTEDLRTESGKILVKKEDTKI